MEKINEYINKFTRDDISNLSSLLGIRNKAGDTQKVKRRLLSYMGISNIFKSLGSDELAIFNIILDNESGITLGDIERESGLPDKQVDEITKHLAGILLVYRLKNRMRLHNRLDKIFVMPEVADFIFREFNSNIDDDITTLYTYLVKQGSSSSGFTEKTGNASPGKFIDYIFGKGGIVTLEQTLDEMPEKDLIKELPALYKCKQIKIYVNRDYPAAIFLLLDREIFHSLLQSEKAGLSGNGIHVRNSYLLLVNLLTVYDTVSTFGLFKTKLGAFRKVDWVRLEKVMLPLYDIDGRKAVPKEELQLSLFLLFRLGCIQVRQESVIVNLKNIQEDFLNPGALLYRLLRTVDERTKPGGLFQPPFPVPSYHCLKDIVNLIYRMSSTMSKYMVVIYVFFQLMKTEKEKLKDIAVLRKRHMNDFAHGLRFLCLVGIVEIKNGLINLSDAGSEFADRVSRRSHSAAKVVPSVYLNPDLTIIIPKYEISSEAQFHLLTHTDIISEDMVINARVCRESIVRAYKRGMVSDTFLETLTKYSKNELPQNLRFLVAEWSGGIVEIDISRPIVLHVNNPELLDELSYDAAHSEGVERISENYALIERGRLDMLLKYFEKKDAIIRLFENENGS